MRLSRPPGPPASGSIGYPIGFAVATVTTLAAVAAGATAHPWLALAALSGVVVGIAAVTTVSAASFCSPAKP